MAASLFEGKVLDMLRVVRTDPGMVLTRHLARSPDPGFQRFFALSGMTSRCAFLQPMQRDGAAVLMASNTEGSGRAFPGRRETNLACIAASLSLSPTMAARSFAAVLPGTNGKRATSAAAAESQQVDMPVAEEEIEVCEVVTGKDVKLGEGDDEFQAHLIQPLKNKNGAAVLLLSDVYGYGNPDTKTFAYRIACFGYSVLLPDLFRGKPWGENFDRSKYEEWRVGHPDERVQADIKTAAAFLHSLAAGVLLPPPLSPIDTDESERAGPLPGEGRVAIIGFCFGGGHLIQVLAEDGSKADASASYSAGVFFYGTRVKLELATDIRVPVLLVAGDSDAICPVVVVKDLAEKIPDATVKIFEGRGHGFAHHPGSMEEDDDAEEAFELARSWLHDHLLLGVPGPWTESLAGSDAIAAAAAAAAAATAAPTN